MKRPHDRALGYTSGIYTRYVASRPIEHGGVYTEKFGPIFRDYIAPELKTDGRTFHLWFELIPDMVNTIVGFLGNVTQHMLSLTCTTYYRKYRADVWRVPPTLNMRLIELLCHDIALAPLLYKYIKYKSEFNPYFDAPNLVECLIRHKRFGWVEWLALETSYSKQIASLGEFIYAIAMGVPGLDGYFWCTGQSWINIKNKTTLYSIHEAAHWGNAILTHFLIDNQTHLNRDETRYSALEVALDSHHYDCFFLDENFDVTREWKTAWLELQRSLIEKPDLCGKFTSLAWSIGGACFIIELWPRFTSNTRDKLLNSHFSSKFIKGLSYGALQTGVNILEKMEANNIPLAYIKNWFHIDMHIPDLLFEKEKHTTFVWLWKHGVFSGPFMADVNRDRVQWQDNVAKAVKWGMAHPERVAMVEELLLMHPFPGSALIIQAAKIGAQIADNTPTGLYRGLNL